VNDPITLSTIMFVATTVLAAIDDDPPRLVVIAGTVQFIGTILFVALRTWWHRLTG
jgi:hypothetical protein